jgi:two-component system response regulator RegA
MDERVAMNVLLVDDDVDFCQVLARTLRRRQLDVLLAHNGRDALRHAADSCERIILDLNLGGENGLNLLPALREHFSDSRILVLTGYASIATAVESIKLGATQYLPKPASVDDILQAFAQAEPDPDLPISPRPVSVRRLGWEYIQRILLENNGNVSATARALGMHRRTLQRMLAKHPPPAVQTLSGREGRTMISNLEGGA